MVGGAGERRQLRQPARRGHEVVRHAVRRVAGRLDDHLDAGQGRDKNAISRLMSERATMTTDLRANDAADRVQVGRRQPVQSADNDCRNAPIRPATIISRMKRSGREEEHD